MENYASNSHKSREQEEKKVEKVIKGDVITRKKSPGKKLAQSFLSEDSSTVWSYILDDVAIPALKSLLSDMVTSTIEMILFGETRSRRGGNYRSGSNTQTSYNSYYNQKNKEPQRSRMQSERVYEDDIILATRGEAEDVLASLRSLIRDYGMASVADLYDAIGMPTNYTQNKYGWYDLNSARVDKVRDGYLINLPRTTYLD